MPTPGPEGPTGRLRRWLEVPSAYAPSVTYDGESVLYLSNATGHPQVWTVPSAGGPSRPLTAGADRIGGVQASPTAPQAIVSVDRGGDEHWQLALLDLGRGKGPGAALRPLTSAPEVVHASGRWTEDGRAYLFASNARDPRFFDLYRIGIDPPSPPARLFTGDGTHIVLDVQGDRVLFARATTNLDADLFLLEGERVVHLNPHTAEVTVHGAALRPDGVYAAANPGRELTALVRFRPGVPHHEFVREFAGDVEQLVAAPSSSLLALVVNRDGFGETHLFDPMTREDRAVLSGPRGVIGGLSWLPDSSAFAYEVSSADSVDVYRRAVETGKERRLTRPAADPPASVFPRLDRVRARDGVTIPFWEYAPRGTLRGTVVYVHGGPESQARPGFNPFLQFLAGEGFRVLAPNVRGSTGYGRTFVHLDDVRKRMDSVRDLKDLLDAQVRQGRAVPGRVGILGASYGGFMVLAAMGTYPELFGAGVDLVGIANLVTFLERTGPWRRRIREAEYGSLEHDRAFLEEISPVAHADRIRAPLLVIHGRNDPRVPLHEAEQIVAAMQRGGRPVDLLVFDDEGHGIVRLENRLVAWTRAAEFLRVHLAAPGDAGAAPGPH